MCVFAYLSYVQVRSIVIYRRGLLLRNSICGSVVETGGVNIVFDFYIISIRLLKLLYTAKKNLISP